MQSLREYVDSRAHQVHGQGCWIWLLSFGSHGYGQGTIPGTGIRVTTAHRISYMAFNGPIPDGMLVQHKCDNKWCVNPDHLELGTDLTNAVDKQIKGRAAKKLAPTDVMTIRRLVVDGRPVGAVAREFGVSQRLVQRIRDLHVWKHIP